MASSQSTSLSSISASDSSLQIPRLLSIRVALAGSRLVNSCAASVSVSVETFLSLSTFPMAPASTISLPKDLSLPPNPWTILHQLMRFLWCLLLKSLQEVVFIKKHMDVNDIEIVLSIMKNAGYGEVIDVPENAEVIFINMCVIRDFTEHEVWQRLNYFWFLKRDWKKNVATGRSQSQQPPKIVVLGCMGERLKEKILDADKTV